MNTLCVCVLVLFAFCAVNGKDTSSVRATWISVDKYLTSPSEAQRTMQSLAHIGITRVYASVWKSGLAYFNSSTILGLVGNAGIAADQLSSAVTYGHKSNIEVYAWFEDGFAAGIQNISNPFFDKSKQLGWYLGDDNGLSWLDSRKSDVVNFFGGLIDDVTSYGIDGILLGSFCLPTRLAGISVDKMTSIAQAITQKFFRNHNNLLLTVALDTLNDSAQACNVDYSWWTGHFFFSGYVPRLFANNYNAYLPLLQQTIQGTSKPSHNDMIIGLLCNGSNNPTPWSELHQMLILSSKKNLGVAIWYAEGVLETYSSNFQNYWK